MLRFILAVIVGFSVAEASSDDPITLLGLDEKGSPVSKLVNRKEYSERITLITNAVNESALTTMNNQMSKQILQEKWSLRVFIVGIGIRFDVGIGPLLSVGFIPRFRLVYSNIKFPITP